MAIPVNSDRTVGASPQHTMNHPVSPSSPGLVRSSERPQSNSPSKPTTLRYLDLDTKSLVAQTTHFLSLLHTQLYNEPHMGLKLCSDNVAKSLAPSAPQKSSKSPSNNNTTTWTDLLKDFERDPNHSITPAADEHTAPEDDSFQHVPLNQPTTTPEDPVAPVLSSLQKHSSQWLEWDGLAQDLSLFSTEIHDASNTLHHAISTKWSPLFNKMKKHPKLFANHTAKQESSVNHREPTAGGKNSKHGETASTVEGKRSDRENGEGEEKTPNSPAVGEKTLDTQERDEIEGNPSDTQETPTTNTTPSDTQKSAIGEKPSDTQEIPTTTPSDTQKSAIGQKPSDTQETPSPTPHAPLIDNDSKPAQNKSSPPQKTKKKKKKKNNLKPKKF